MSSRIPNSNQKVFAISTIVAFVVIVGFIAYARMNPNAGVNKEVMSEAPDPAKVFDAPFQTANLYYIDLGKYEGQASSSDMIGCGDAVVAYEIPVGELNGATKPDAVNFVLAQLFDNSTFTMLASSSPNKAKDAYNALANSKFSIKTIKDVPGQYEVRITGTPKQAGVCDAPRIQAQIEKTINGIFAPENVKVFLNDKALAEALGSK